ncbi:DUF2750 domain-containing protein [Salinimonas chungwhensis]|uniref:DUF2750 domain-containing protein n=1 Tax=Salinimonas chungwhensis TaxID=265425 RepID=UPI000363C6E0|nr:DUF2750 domain-containing protein [Salinimonas chungwhensis]
MFPETVTNALSSSLIKQAASLSAEERQALFMQYSEKAGALWLRQGAEGYVMIAPEQCATVAEFSALLPVWPHQSLVALWPVPDDNISQPVSLQLSEFLDTWLPGLKKNNVGVVIFPIADDNGMVMSADELLTYFADSGVAK